MLAAMPVRLLTYVSCKEGNQKTCVREVLATFQSLMFVASRAGSSDSATMEEDLATKLVLKFPVSQG